MRTFSKAFVVILLAILALATPLKSQGSFAVSAGVGGPEIFHLGFRVKLADQWQLGAFIGSAFGSATEQRGDAPKEKIDAYAMGLAAFFHFGGQSAHTPLKPWYLRAGLSYVHFDGTDYISKYNHADIRLGRGFNLTPRSGLELDAGLALMLSHKHQTKPGGLPEGLPVEVENKVLPAFGLRFFYKIL
ncbi:MAG: autotransporter outer membrane beta-barrel domain-containing protein [Bacteroidales bacterium]|nr:autotransporter outer membrane beta-barrel domain-containing protein [Bacteroidales bacterium]